MRRFLALALALAVTSSDAFAQRAFPTRTYRGSACAESTLLDGETWATGAPFCFDLFVTSHVIGYAALDVTYDADLHDVRVETIGPFVFGGTAYVRPAAGGAAMPWTFDDFHGPTSQTRNRAIGSFGPYGGGEDGDYVLERLVLFTTVKPYHSPDPYMNGFVYTTSSVTLTATPEPATIALLGTGLLVFAAAARRRRDG